MKRTYLYALAVLIIILIVAYLVLSSSVPVLGGVSPQKLASFDNKPVPGQLLSLLAVPDNVSGVIGIGVTGTKSITQIKNGSELTLDGKPEVLYIGAEYCPYCAAERWPMIIALMRFGTFSNLHLMTSSASDVYASTPTFDFYNSTYTSQYISFVPVETTTNNETPLQAPNASQAQLFGMYDPDGGIPFILFANKTYWINANYDPQYLDGKNWTTIAQSLYNTSSVQSEAILGTANLMTAQICSIDGNQPASVCSQGYIKSIESGI